MLEAISLLRRFGDFTAVQDISLHLAQGEIVGFLGRNGAGKTTSIEMLAGIAPPDAGRVTIDGMPVSHQQIRIGFLPEGAPLWPELSISTTLRLAAGLAGMDAKTTAARISKILELTELRDRQNQRVGTLSKGLHARTALAFALMADPDYLLLDEPFDGFDPVQRRAGRALLRDLAQSKGILVCTHSLREAEILCDRIIILHAGRIVAQGTLQEVCGKEDFEDTFARLTGEVA